MFSNFKWYDWLIGLFTYGLWILWKLYKNGAIDVDDLKKKGGKLTGGKKIIKKTLKWIAIVWVGLVVMAGISSLFSEKEIATTIDTQTVQTVAKPITISELFKLGMKKENIPSKINLLRGKRLEGYIKDHYIYSDQNNNEININGFDFKVSFNINDTDGYVESIKFESENINDISKSELKKLATVFAKDKQLKYSKYYQFKKFGYKEIINGNEYNIAAIYAVKDKKLKLYTMVTNVKEKAERIDRLVQKTTEDSFVIIKKNSYICTSSSAYEKLFDYAAKKPNSSFPSSKCIGTKDKEYRFRKTDIYKIYNGSKMLRLLNNKNDEMWVWEDYIK
jgi:hypothetical protein